MNQKSWVLIFYIVLSQMFVAIAFAQENQQPYEVVSKIVGQVSDYFITSREVQAQFLMGSVVSLDMNLKNENLKVNMLPEILSLEFQGALNQTILEKVVSLEADSFSFAQIPETEINELKKLIETNLKNKPNWKNLQVDDSELETWLKIKRRAQNYIDYKTELNSMKINEDEIRSYFDQNRYKFGSSSYVAFKDNIRQFLLKQKISSRLKEWFEVLRKKYKVRTFVQNAT